MEPMKMAKQMIDFNKATFENTFNAMVMVQEQMERTVGTFLEKANWLPDEGKKLMNEWMSTYKKGREDFKKTVDESYKKLEDYFGKTE